jgi:hypothetical protein
MPRKLGIGSAHTRAAEPRGRLTDSATENQTACRPQGWQARVKRWGKSPPPREQSRGHGKPHPVQGQIGDDGVARSLPGEQAQARKLGEIESRVPTA